MAKATRLAMFVGGIATAGVAAMTVLPAAPARAASGKGGLIIQTDNIAGASGVPANQIISVSFSQPIDPSTVRPETVLIRSQNQMLTGYTKQIFGSYQVVGNTVHF